MLADYTPAVSRALQAAQECARRSGATDVQPLHLLEGLLAEQEGRAALLLARGKLSVATVKQVFAGQQTIPTAPTIGPPLPLNTKTQAIVYDARELAADLTGDSTIASDHVMLALLRRDESIRQKVVALGLDLAALESEMASPSPPALPVDEALHLVEPTEHTDTARILDASANRAREALRVIEDYCRFVLDDRLLSGELKRLRHDLTETVAGFPPGLLEARDTLRDVGTSLSTEGERRRLSLQGVVQANLKRLQEALRSLEEYGKLQRPDLGAALEQIRYRSYTLERAILLGTRARRRLADARLYVLITGSLCASSLDWTIQEAAAGGAEIIQLREKNLTDRKLLERARQVRRWTEKANTVFILNDRPDLARLADADGVHLGQDDLGVKEARRILGPEALIGVSTHNLDQVRQAVMDGASYIGVGPTFASLTKHFPELPGLEFIRQAAEETSLPAFVIGGVNLERVQVAIKAGARRVAVSQAICQAEDPRAAASELRRILDDAWTRGSE
jgi:thiamine-phosphate pyrophosphorylase